MTCDDTVICFPQMLMDRIISEKNSGKQNYGYLFCEFNKELTPFYLSLRGEYSEKKSLRNYREVLTKVISSFLLENNEIELMPVYINPDMPKMRDIYNPDKPRNEDIITILELYNSVGSKCRDNMFAFKDKKPYFYRCNKDNATPLKNDEEHNVVYVKKIEGLSIDNSEARGKELEERLAKKFVELMQ